METNGGKNHSYIAVMQKFLKTAIKVKDQLSDGKDWIKVIEDSVPNLLAAKRLQNLQMLGVTGAHQNPTFMLQNL